MSSPDHRPALDRFTLGPWRIDASLDTVSRPGLTHKLEPRTMRLLTTLARAEGKLVRTETLLEEVWPGLIVTPSSVYDSVAQLRKALGPDHIGTVARKGYRLLTRVQTAPPAIPSSRATALPSDLPADRTVEWDAIEPRLGPRSVAVLPFAARRLPDTLSFLSESLTGGLIAELSRQPDLAVIAHGTMLVFGHRRAMPQQVATELGVRYVVDGQLELRAEVLHVDVLVVDCERGTQTWADTLELPAHAWHETASVVVGRLARALRFELNGLASQVIPPSTDAEIQARALAAQSWVQLYARLQTPETNAKANALADRARELAPRLAQAWMCLAYCDWRAGQYRWSDEARDRQLARSLASAERAVELDSRDPDGYYVLSLTTRYLGQRARADEALRHCLRLASSYAPAYGLLAMSCIRRGQIQEARVHCARAFALSPLEPLRVIWHSVRAEASLVLGDVQDAFDEAQRGMAANPGFAQVYLFGTAAAWQLGARAQARAWVMTLRSHKAFGTVQAVRTSVEDTYDETARGQLERLIELLTQAGLPAR